MYDLHNQHSACEHIYHDCHSHCKKTLEWKHISICNAFARPGTVMIEAFHTKPAIWAMLSYVHIFSIYHMTQVTIEVRSIQKNQHAKTLTLKFSLYSNSFKNAHLYLWEVVLDSWLLSLKTKCFKETKSRPQFKITTSARFCPLCIKSIRISHLSQIFQILRISSQDQSRSLAPLQSYCTKSMCIFQFSQALDSLGTSSGILL